jgi:hypothetical protein
MGGVVSRLVVIELLQHLLHVIELLLRLLDGRPQQLEALLLCDIVGALCILLLAVVLDLLTRVFDLCEAEGGGRALEEVAELRERLQVLLLATDGSVGGHICAERQRRGAAGIAWVGSAGSVGLTGLCPS